MRFKIRCLIRHKCICSSVCLVESIGCKTCHFVENVNRNMFCNTILFAAFNKMTAFLFHYIGFLFTHSTSHNISLSIGITCHFAAYLHYLLLINNTSVCNIEYFFQHRMLVTDIAGVVSVCNKCWNGVHRTWAIKRNNRNKVFDIHRFKAHHNIAHTFRFKLEHTCCIPHCKHFKYFFVIMRNSINIKIRLNLFYHFGTMVNNGKSSQAKKVHFKQTKFLNCSHRELSYNLTFVALQRYILLCSKVSNNNPCCMG